MTFFDWIRRPFASQSTAPVMKDDHEEHFTRLRELHAVLDSVREQPEDCSSRNSTILSIIRRLLDGAREHFDREQTIMGLYGYPRRDAHLKEHQAMLGSAERFYERLMSGTDPIDDDVIRYFKGWLVNHMKNEDAKLEHFLSTSRPVGKLGKLAGGV